VPHSVQYSGWLSKKWFKKARAPYFRGSLIFKSGDDLLSHIVANAVPSALEGLTSVFGMGTGVTPPLESPEILVGHRQSAVDSKNEYSFTADC
jgi:hypothetical protein